VVIGGEQFLLGYLSHALAGGSGKFDYDVRATALPLSLINPEIIKTHAEVVMAGRSAGPTCRRSRPWPRSATSPLGPGAGREVWQRRSRRRFNPVA
jgi:hypothetical protein